MNKNFSASIYLLLMVPLIKWLFIHNKIQAEPSLLDSFAELQAPLRIIFHPENFLNRTDKWKYVFSEWFLSLVKFFCRVVYICSKIFNESL